MNVCSLLRTAASLALGVVVSLGIAAGPARADAIDDFVTRFYDDVLEREPEPAGLAGWSAYLHGNCNAMGFSTISQGFFGSPEFVQTNSDTLDQLVRKFYRTFLGREPDPGGQAAWVSILRQGRLAVALRGFVPSREFQSLLPNRSDPAAVSALVTRLYMQILRRAPDPPGLSAWVDYVVRTGDLEGAAQGFIASPEFEARGQTFLEYVTTLYRTFLDRAPDELGRDAWVKVLTDSMLQVINMGFVPSAEFQGLSAVLCSNGGVPNTTVPNAGIPSIVGTYSGTLDLTQTMCTSMMENGTFMSNNGTFEIPLTVSITGQDVGVFTGSGAVFDAHGGGTVLELIATLTLSGTVSASGSTVGSFTARSVAAAPPVPTTIGMFNGSVVGKMLNLDLNTQDIAGDTCVGTGSFSGTRP